MIIQNAEECEEEEKKNTGEVKRLKIHGCKTVLGLTQSHYSRFKVCIEFWILNLAPYHDLWGFHCS